METMRSLFFSWQLSFLIFSSTATGTQVDNPNQSGQSQTIPPDSVTVTGKAPHDPAPLPALPPDEFTDCLKARGTTDLRDPGAIAAMAICEAKLDWERRVVVETCINLDGKTALPKVVQGCTESLDRKIFQGSDRYYLFANRADAYFAQGDKPRALEDYNEAIRLAPKNAKLYYNRGVFYAAQSDGPAALRDFDMALNLNPQLVLALQQRAKIDLTQDNLNGALADYSEAIRLQPKTAALWSERGYVCLRLHNYDSAVKDEAQAIQLDPKLARAYFLRGAAFGDLGNSPNAVSDLVTAVSLDPTLDRYISSKGKSASITLPPP
jgi:Flp pilus assembly protein TadD